MTAAYFLYRPDSPCQCQTPQDGPQCLQPVRSGRPNIGPAHKSSLIAVQVSYLIPAVTSSGNFAACSSLYRTPFSRSADEFTRCVGMSRALH